MRSTRDRKKACGSLFQSRWGLLRGRSAFGVWLASGVRLPPGRTCAADEMPPVDEIAITGIRAFGRHGAYAGEKDRPQAFDVALKLELDLSIASQSDRLGDTIDYAEIHRRVVEIVEQRSFDLLERLGAAIMEAAFDDARVVAVGGERRKAGVARRRDGPSHAAAFAVGAGRPL